MQDIMVFMQNHWSLSAALLAVLVILVFLEFIKQKRNVTDLSPARVTQLINRDNAVVIDLRNTDGYGSGHIIDAVSIPASTIKSSNKLEKFKTKPIILTCATGLDSQRTAPLLTKQGYNVFTLAGGLRAWKESGLPLVKS